MRKMMVALALGAACLGGAAGAQDAPRRGGGMGGGGMGLMRADANGDGVVTRAEYQAQIDSRFARMDANGDGKLDADELPMRGMGRMGAAGAPPPPPPSAGAASPPPPPAPMAAGTTRDQFRAAMMTRFDRLDANHDGRLDAGELPARGGRPGTPPAPPAN